MLSNDYLSHHGILGQKWGVRRFQNKDGTLKPAGEKRYYGSLKEEAQAKHKSPKGLKKDGYNDTPSVKVNRAAKTVGDAAGKKRYYDGVKEKVGTLKKKYDSRTEKKVNKMTKIYRHENNELSEEEARRKAERRIKTERILLATAAVGVTAIAATAAYKYHKSQSDILIKAGGDIQRIVNGDSSGQLHDTFYAAVNKHDKVRYAGLMPRQHFGGNAKKMTIGVNETMKVAGDRSAKKIFNELQKTDKNFADVVTQVYGGYDGFNRQAMLGGANSDEAQKFIGALKKAGYSGVQDVNDKKYSGYGAHAPAILFNNGKNFAVKEVHNMGVSELDKEQAKLFRQVAVESMPNLMLMVGGYSAAGMITTDAQKEMEYNEAVARERRKNARKKGSTNVSTT